MKDKRFISQRRRGMLSPEQHQELVRWACGCADHIISKTNKVLHPDAHHALRVAHGWTKGQKNISEARVASVKMLALARTLTCEIELAVACCIAHAVGTAHTSDHSLSAAIYALKAASAAGLSVVEEREWQNAALPEAIRPLIMDHRYRKEISMGVIVS